MVSKHMKRLYRHLLVATTATLVGLALAVLHPGPATRAALTPIPILFTQNNNVVLMNSDGTGRVAITSSGTSQPNGTSYPWYSWSPDGRYILLVRTFNSLEPSEYSNLLLLNQGGYYVRTLATHLPPPGLAFYPDWAVDGDQIAYIASVTAPNANNRTSNTVDRVDVTGTVAPFWTFQGGSVQVGCGVALDRSLQLYWSEVGCAGTPTIQWSVQQHLAVYKWAFSNLEVTDTRTGVTSPFPQPETADPALQVTIGRIAFATRGTSPGPQRIAVANVSSIGSAQIMGPGELPLWSHDGRVLYFVRVTSGKSLHMIDQFGNDVSSNASTAAIWRVNADGTGAMQIAAEEGAALGQLHLSADGQSLIFSHIDDELRLWRHRLPGDLINDGLLARYGPGIQVQQLDLVTGHIVTLIRNASHPAPQP